MIEEPKDDEDVPVGEQSQVEKELETEKAVAGEE